MSQFDQHSGTAYKDKLCLFIANAAELLGDGICQKQSRQVEQFSESIEVLEKLVNAKAERAEASDSTMGERLQIAMAYKRLSNADIALSMAVSTHLVELWNNDAQRPSDLETLAHVLDVPRAWLELGSELNLPANSHIGVRVGAEVFACRESLYVKTLELVAKMPETFGVDAAQSLIEEELKTNQSFATTSRRAGGAWQVSSGTLIFVPWIRFERPHRFNDNYLSDEVEAIVNEELNTKATVYSAWCSIKSRCKAMHLAHEKFPSLISLHKRMEKK